MMKTTTIMRMGVSLILGGGLVSPLLANSAHHEFLGGPWEVVVKMGLEGQGVHLPVTVTHEDKPQSLDLPVTLAGLPVQVRLTQYLPDLRQQTVAAADPNGGDVVRLSLAGENLQQQELWLAAKDPSRRSMSSSIGGISVIQLERLAGARALKALTRTSTVGVLAVWLPGEATPLETVVGPKTKVKLPQGHLTVLDYVPHYTIDRGTKAVVSLSDEPVNPALLVRLDYQDQEYEQWIWAKFPHTPHSPMDLPLRMKFWDYSPPAAGHYLLTTTPDRQAWLFYRQGRKPRLDPMTPGARFPFKNKQYTFSLEEIQSRACIKEQWVNHADILRRPAVVATLQRGQTLQEVVLELGQPYHYRSDQGAMVLLYRKVPSDSEQRN